MAMPALWNIPTGFSLSTRDVTRRQALRAGGVFGFGAFLAACYFTSDEAFLAAFDADPTMPWSDQ
jgi:hypothetical protein